MKNAFKKYLLLFTLFLISANLLYSQAWEKSIDLGRNEGCTEVKRTSDNNYILTGNSELTGDSSAIILAKIDSLGNLIWSKTFIDSNSATQAGHGVAQTTDGGYIIVGQWTFGSIYKAIVIKTDANGNIQWKKYFDDGANANGLDIDLTSDGGYIITGWSEKIQNSELYLLKIDAQGNKVWSRNYGVYESIGYDVKETSDAGFIICGAYGRGSTQTTGSYLVKTDSLGLLQWEKVYGYSNFGSFTGSVSVEETSGGGYILTGFDRSWSDLVIIKTDHNGNIIWDKIYDSGWTQQGAFVKETSNNSFIISGVIVATTNTPVNSGYLIKLDRQGNEIWSRVFKLNTNLNYVDELSNGNYFLVGNIKNVDGDIYVVTVDSNGVLYPNSIEGRLINDSNNNCNIDTNELLIKNKLIQATDANNTFYALTDSNGAYSLDVGLGQYNLEPANLSPYWESSNCASLNQTVSFTNINQTKTADFFIKGDIFCPYLNVDVSTPFIRRCDTSTYTAYYCNDGTESANNVKIEITLNDFMHLTTSSLPWTQTQPGNTYEFNVGQLDINECGNFNFNVGVDCDSTFLGQTLCVNAHIFPDSLCTPLNNNWDGAEIELDVECSNTDSVIFTITNTGAQDMQSSIVYNVLNNDTLITSSSFLLNAGSSKNESYFANGSLYTMVTDLIQTKYGPSILVDFNEACGHTQNNHGLTPFLFSNTFDLSDGNPFTTSDCQQIIGSFDPNDKQVFPKGIGSEGIVSSDTELEYLIRFQNTGTDTAFKVIINDKISDKLDLSSLKPGSSSHNYELSIVENRTLKWTFNQILLPDSNTNEPKSHGFVKYKINPKNNAQIGSVIKNKAGIVFDFNTPIITNTTTNTIGEIDKGIIVINSIENKTEIPVKIYPNPFSNIAIIELPHEYNRVTISVADINGKLVYQSIYRNSNKIEFNGKNLQNGFYLIQIHADGEVISTAKIIKSTE